MIIYETRIHCSVGSVELTRIEYQQNNLEDQTAWHHSNLRQLQQHQKKSTIGELFISLYVLLHLVILLVSTESESNSNTSIVFCTYSIYQTCSLPTMNVGAKARFHHLYPNSKILEGDLLQVEFEIYVNDASKSITVCLSRDFKYIYAWGANENIQFDDVIEKICAEMSCHANQKFYEKVILFLNFLQDEILQTINGISVLPKPTAIKSIAPYSPIEDGLWDIVRVEYPSLYSKPIRIITYGTRFHVSPPEPVDKIFDAASLRGNHFVESTSDMESVKRELVKLRGTNLAIQADVRHAVLFEDFVRDIISFVQNHSGEERICIAITCRAGHHRSVAVAEMLKFLYPQVATSHYTIYR